MTLPTFWLWKWLILIVVAAALTSASVSVDIDNKASNTSTNLSSETNSTTESTIGQCPPLDKWGACPDDALPCDDVTRACPGTKKCCSSACGRVCVEPLFTACEHYRQSAVRRARTLGPKASVPVPLCSAEGAFEAVQCSAPDKGPCWCVDEAGAELPGTMAPTRQAVNCSVPLVKCPAHSCRMLCPLGFALDPTTGCPICACRDPCQGVTCPGKQQCHLQEVACITQPCPPVPTCKRARSLQEMCPLGSPLSIADTERPFLCGNDAGKPSCPPLYRCLVQKGNDYGVCCPASLQLRKAGSCPAKSSGDDSRGVTTCGPPCQHDLECPGSLKCCQLPGCGMQCNQPENVTTCHQQRMLSELLVISEREGRGYVPQCEAPGGHFSPRQCSRNGLVCWCVEPRSGHKVPGSIGAAKGVQCEDVDWDRAVGRSLQNTCDTQICAAVCEYGFKSDESGCPTCECDEPCAGYKCPLGQVCEVARDPQCEQGGALTLCESQPVCRPNIAYTNPCSEGTPLTNASTGELLNCGDDEDERCPGGHTCTSMGKISTTSLQAVCCPEPQRASLSLQDITDERPQSMCEYLRDFSTRMEGTVEGLALALVPPKCAPDGAYAPAQCAPSLGQCWCVDNFGTEIPKTRGDNVTTEHCQNVREELGCLDITCRMGCDYGFILDPTTGCPTCQCRDPCQGVTCPGNQQCQAVEVACGTEYCAPVPACLPRKEGQCPFLLPPAGGVSGDCVMECSSDSQCSGSKRCCATGCGTQCVMPDMRTACQHLQAIQKHQAHESGIPARQLYIAQCSVGGAFERVQCGSHGSHSSCWCVEPQTGVEVQGTRVSSGQTPDCDAPRECPLRKCVQSCEHGFAFDDVGCHTCSCLDPCANVTCKVYGEVCKLIEVQCSDGPCPPVAVCMPNGDNPCQEGTPLIQGGSELQCGPNGGQEGMCPSTHNCQISPFEDRAVCCPKPRDVCWETLEQGRCPQGSGNNTEAQRWHFSPQKNKCEPFQWGGCSANHNNFHSLQACEAVCPVLSQCERLREKNRKAADRYGKATFSPMCDPTTGAWAPAQCLGVMKDDPRGPDEKKGTLCWCVDPKGTLLKGSLTRGAEPECNYRQARGRKINIKEDDKVMEELIRQLTAFDFVESIESNIPDQELTNDNYKNNDNKYEISKIDTDLLVEPIIPDQTAIESDVVYDTKSGFDNLQNIAENSEKNYRKPENMEVFPSSTTDHNAISNNEKDIKMNAHSKSNMAYTKRTRCESIRDSVSASFPVTCDAQGSFLPTQCNGRHCWCVDEAGNQLENSVTFVKGEQDCMRTPIEAVEVELGLLGAIPAGLPGALSRQLGALIEDLGGSLVHGAPLETHNHAEGVTVHFQIGGDNKVDVAYQLEELVKTRNLSIHPDPNNVESILIGDITRSRFRHRTRPQDIPVYKVQLSQQPQEAEPAVTLLQTAVFVLATGSAFLVAVFVVFVMLYKGKMARNVEAAQEKSAELGERFLAYSPPVYVLSTADVPVQPQNSTSVKTN